MDYLASAQVVSVAVDLGNGSLDKTREWCHAAVVTENYRFGRNAAPRVGWFTALDFGRRFSVDLEDSAFFSVEAGIEIPLGRRTYGESNEPA